MVDDLWNDNRRLERLLKTEVGATSVALGTANPAYVCTWERMCARVCGCVCPEILHMDSEFLIHVRTSDLSTLVLCNHRKTQAVFTSAPTATQPLSLETAADDVWAEITVCGLRRCLNYGSVSVTVCKKDLLSPLLPHSPNKSWCRVNC